MGIQVVRVEVDVHEPTALREELGRLGADVRIRLLPIGDYRTGDALVERKIVRDLHLTLAAGRLWGQLGRIRAAGRRPFLLVEGALFDAGPIPPAAIRGALLAVGENGVTVVRSENQADSALWLYRIACRASRSRAPRNRPLYAQRPKRSEPEAVLAAIPDISTVTARALLSHFGSIAAVVKAPDADLREVHGVGPVRSRTIRETFTQTHRAYRSRRSRE
jgi:ERCC4-type nuclease